MKIHNIFDKSYWRNIITHAVEKVFFIQNGDHNFRGNHGLMVKASKEMEKIKFPFNDSGTFFDQHVFENESWISAETEEDSEDPLTDLTESIQRMMDKASLISNEVASIAKHNPVISWDRKASGYYDLSVNFFFNHSHSGTMKPVDGSSINFPWHDSMRYLRLSYAEKNLETAYLLAYMALERSFTEVTDRYEGFDRKGKPKKLTEDEWLMKAARSLDQKDPDLSHALQFYNGSINDMCTEIYNLGRLPIAHSKFEGNRKPDEICYLPGALSRDQRILLRKLLYVARTLTTAMISKINKNAGQKAYRGNVSFSRSCMMEMSAAPFIDVFGVKIVGSNWQRTERVKHDNLSTNNDTDRTLTKNKISCDIHESNLILGDISFIKKDGSDAKIFDGPLTLPFTRPLKNVSTLSFVYYDYVMPYKQLHNID